MRGKVLAVAGVMWLAPVLAAAEIQEVRQSIYGMD